MKKAGKYRKKKRRPVIGALIVIASILAVVIAVEEGRLPYAANRDEGSLISMPEPTQETSPAPTQPTEPTESTEPVDPTENWETGFVATLGLETAWYDADGAQLGMLPRGAQVKYEIDGEGKTAVLFNGRIGYLQEEASVVSDPADIIPVHSLYVRTAVNLRDADGKLLETFANKGEAVEVNGYDYICEDGQAHMYRVTFGEAEGYILPWYLAEKEEDALANYDDGDYAIHADRGNRYGGGGAADLVGHLFGAFVEGGIFAQEEVGVGEIGEDARIDAAQGTFAIFLQSFGGVAMVAEIAAARFLADGKMIAENEEIQPLLGGHRGQPRHIFFKIFAFQPDLDGDAVLILLAQAAEIFDIIVEHGHFHADVAAVAGPERPGAMVGKAEHLYACGNGREYVSFVIAYGVFATVGVGMVVGFHGCNSPLAMSVRIKSCRRAATDRS